MVKEKRPSAREIELEVERYSLIGDLKEMRSFHGENSREILLFRYPEKRGLRI